MIYYTIHYMNPYIYMDDREVIADLLRRDDNVDEFYNRYKMYYNMHFDGVFTLSQTLMTDDDIVELVFKLADGVMENHSIPKFQIPYRSIQTGDIITIDDGDRWTNPISYMYKPFDHIILKEPVIS